MKELTSEISTLTNYLQQQNWLHAGEKITGTEVPGDGNMNFTLRVITDERSFIVKQSRGYVEKYPQVAAPQERALREAEFYQTISAKPQLAAEMPRLIGVDKENNVLLMEDLGEGSDFTNLYKKGEQIERENLKELMEFAAALHNAFPVDAVEKPITNREMRTLNHEHMYVYPYLTDNGLNLNDVLPGLQKAAMEYKQNDKLREEAKKLGEMYLADGERLLHGDYFPGSWLKTNAGIKVIDPEFCFFGPPEFEVGVCLAHLKMATQPQELIDTALQTYDAKAKLDKNLCQRFMAGEMLRRILGLAQLPLEIDLEERKTLLKEAADILLN